MDITDEHDDQPSKPLPRAKSHRKKSLARRLLKIFLPLLIIAAILGGVWLWWRAMNGTNYGSVQNTQPGNAVVAAEKPVEYAVLDLGKVQLSYPTYFQVLANTRKQADLIDYKVLTGKGEQTGDNAKIGVTLKAVTTPLADSSAFRFYSERKSTYDIKTETIHNEPVYVISKRSSDFERAVFWPHNGMVLIVAVTAANDPSGALAEQSQRLLASIAWQ